MITLMQEPPSRAPPQSGAVEAPIGATKTEELAVMLDTHAPLFLTKEALELEDPEYWKSWQTRVTAGPSAEVHTTGD